MTRANLKNIIPAHYLFCWTDNAEEAQKNEEKSVEEDRDEYNREWLRNYPFQIKWIYFTRSETATRIEIIISALMRFLLSFAACDVTAAGGNGGNKGEGGRWGEPQ